MLVVIMPIGGGTGGPHGPRPHFYFWGACPPLLSLEFCLNRNLFGIGCIVEVNRLMKNCCRIVAVFCQLCSIYIACNLARFRNCLAEYAVHSLSPCYGLLTALVLLNSVAI